MGEDILNGPSDFISGGGSSGSGGPPSGAAGGALSGTYPNPDLASGVAGAGLSKTGNVLAVAYGSGANTAAQGNDARLSDTRTPTDATVTDAKITAGGLSPSKIAGTAVITTDSRLSDTRTPTDGTVTDAKIATTLSPSKITGTAVITTDSRLSDARTPTAHSSTHYPGGSDELFVNVGNGPVSSARVENIPRWSIGSNLTVTNGTVWLMYFTCPFAFTISTLTTMGFAVSGANPTLARYGLYTVAGNGDLTLVCQTSNSSSNLSASTVLNPIALASGSGFNSTYTTIASQRYAFGIIATGSTAPPKIQGASTVAAVANLTPFLMRSFGSQTDLPTSITNANAGSAGSGTIPWCAIS